MLSYLSNQPLLGSTSESTAAVELIRRQGLPGQVVTGDAMFCQREICQTIIGQNADYLLVVKGNQRELKEAIASEFAAGRFPPTESKGSGKCNRWPGSRAMLMVAG